VLEYGLLLPGIIPHILYLLFRKPQTCWRACTTFMSLLIDFTVGFCRKMCNFTSFQPLFYSSKLYVNMAIVSYLRCTLNKQSSKNCALHGKVITGEPWMIFYHCLAVTHWSPEFSSPDAKVKRTVVWVRFPT